jgi:hypothetical protein
MSDPVNPEAPRRLSRTEVYQQRKQAGLCLWCGSESAVEDSGFCVRHQRLTREYNRKYARQTRSERRAAGLCAICGAVPSEKYRCLKCALRDGRITLAGVDVGVEKKRVQGWDERLERNRGATSGYTHKRYHGQARRGRQTVAALDDQDLTDALKRIEKARAGLAIARSEEMQQLPRIQRENAIREALSQADHGIRFAEEVLDRNRYRTKRDKDDR